VPCWCHDGSSRTTKRTEAPLVGRWWKDLDSTLSTDKHVDLKTVHKLQQ